MRRTFAKYVGAGAAAITAAFLGGKIAIADPPVAPPRGTEPVRTAPRDAVRDSNVEARQQLRNDRVERRAHRAPGELGLRLGNIADRGLAIANLVTNSVFYDAGLRPGDYIVSVDGHRLVNQADFEQYLYAAGPDQPIQIVVWRNGADQTLTIQPSVLYANDNYDTYLTDFGVEFDPQYADQLLIRRVIPGSRAYLAGLRDGDVITNWNGERVRSPRDFGKIIHDEKPGNVGFDYTRGGKTIQGNVNFDRRDNADRGPSDRTAQRDTRSTSPTTVTPRAPAREPIPTVTPPANPREPTPTVAPPTNPREPIPTVTPPAGRTPSTVPEQREPPRANPPAASNPPAAPRPENGTAPREK